MAAQPCDMFLHERQAYASCSSGSVAGIDEAGRGPLAGPLVVAAVILPPEKEFDLAVADSKTLSARRRQELAEALLQSPGLCYVIVECSARRIDQLNILAATHLAMRQCARLLLPRLELALVDGLPVPHFPLPARFLVKGDRRSASIAAASILAKTHRDRLMLRLHRFYPQYGFDCHKGYASAAHLKALEQHGPCPAHRVSFAPVARIISPPPEQLSFDFSQV
ncbi:MAG: ribonuclease HII [Lentisphaeria bacterium]|nr:ribonuclease HII [Lentisphaeria bacterium]